MRTVNYQTGFVVARNVMDFVNTNFVLNFYLLLVLQVKTYIFI